jgi:hypothetical protein
MFTVHVFVRIKKKYWLLNPIVFRQSLTNVKETGKKPVENEDEMLGFV